MNLSKTDCEAVARAVDRFGIAPAVLVRGPIVGKGLEAEIRTCNRVAKESSQDCADPLCGCQCCRVLEEWDPADRSSSLLALSVVTRADQAVITEMEGRVQ